MLSCLRSATFLCLVGTLLLLQSVNANAQEQTMIAQGGTSSYGSYQPGGIDTINLANGSVLLNIPMFSYPQKGTKLHFSFSLKYSPTPWYYSPATSRVDPSDGVTHYVGSWYNQSPNVDSDAPVGVSFVRDQGIAETVENLTYPCKNPSGYCGGITGPRGDTGVTATNAYLYSIVTSDRAVHNFGIQGNDPTNGSTFIPTLDGTNFSPINAAFSGFIGPDGITYYPASTDTGGYTSGGFNQSDPEGNKITVSDSGWTDSMGRQIPGSTSGPGYGGQQYTLNGDPLPGVQTSDLSQCASTASAARTLTIPAFNNATTTYTLCYTNQTAATAFASPYLANSDAYLITENQGSDTYLLLTQVVLPNNTSYSFTYDSYINLKSVILPTGGRITYGYTTAQWNDINHSQSRVISTRTVTNLDGTSSTWNYNVIPGQYNTSPNETLITDPAGNDEDHVFGGGETGSETISYYSGTGSSRSLLKTTTSIYSTNVSPIRIPEQDGHFPYNPGPTTSVETVWASTNLVSQTVYTPTPAVSTSVSYVDYGDNYNGLPLPVQTCTTCISTSQIASVQEYGYGTGQPGALQRTTTTQYQWQQVPAYYSANMITLPYSVTVQDSSGDPVAQTLYTYDNGISGNGPGLLGNLTSTQRWLSGSNYVTSSTVYSSAGVPQQMQDANGNVTQVTAFACNGAFPQTVVSPSGSTTTTAETTTYTYDCNTGAQAAITDPNGNLTSYSFDSLNRPTSIVFPNTGSQTWTYTNAVPTSGSPSSVLVTTQTGEQAGPIVSNTVYDGFGRVTETQVRDVKVDSTYDVMGRLRSMTNPYNSSPTGSTTYSYDALSRKTGELESDNSQRFWCYNGGANQQQSSCAPNASSVTNAVWIDYTDEMGNHSQEVSDALGRLVAVVEPNPTTGSLGLETDYTYDSQNNLLTVNQHGLPSDTARSRSFSYDALSRLVTSYNPETGTICYGQISEGTCQEGYDNNGNLLTKTDARGVLTTYKYDALNRMVAKLVASTKTGATGLASCYVYDVNSAAAMANAIGRLTAEWTQPGACPAGATTVPTSGAKVLTSRVITAYNTMGAVKAQQTCALNSCTNAHPQTYSYDLVQNLTGYTDAIGAISFTQSYDATNRLLGLTSSLNDASHPSSLLNISSYGPFGWTGATMGGAATLSQTFDNRQRISSHQVTAGVQQ